MKYYLIIVNLLIIQISFAQGSLSNSYPEVWSLEDCINYALENNITIKDAALNKSILEVDYNKAKSSRLPNLFGSASQSFSSGNTIDPITSDYVTDQINSTNVGFKRDVKTRMIYDSKFGFLNSNEMFTHIKNYMYQILQRAIILNYWFS